MGAHGGRGSDGLVESDEELLQRSKTEPRCFEELVALHGSRVHGYLSRRAPAAADDLSGEVWLAAFEGRHRYDPSLGVVAAWLFGIARHVLLAHQRRQRRQGQGVLLLAPLVGGHVHDTWASVDARLDAACVVGSMRAALAALPPDEREVLLLVAWEQLSPSEAAGVLDIPAGTARSRLHRARTRLVEAWEARTEVDPMPSALSHRPGPVDAKGTR